MEDRYTQPEKLTQNNDLTVNVQFDKNASTPFLLHQKGLQFRQLFPRDVHHTLNVCVSYVESVVNISWKQLIFGKIFEQNNAN